jgi:hypothetical protein
MGISAQKHAVLTSLAALEAMPRTEGFGFVSGRRRRRRRPWPSTAGRLAIKGRKPELAT